VSAVAGPSVEETSIPGLLVLRLPVHEDARGWFKESWQRERMVAAGLPDFGPVQGNVSFNTRRGVTRGFHAEPWDKLLSLATGRAFAAWVDLREGRTFGSALWLEMDPSVAVFVPRGVGNSFQALEDRTAYTYLVNDHFRPDVAYTGVALDDPDLAVPWPVPLTEAVVSDKDRRNPRLSAVRPMTARRPLVLGGGGQLGRALAAALPEAVVTDRATLDVTDTAALEAWDWAAHDIVLNAAAYTAVDTAETEEGRRAAWAVNAHAPATLARLAVERGFVLVHYSTDYVHDGTTDCYDETATFSPLGVYGQSKAAGDLAVSVAPRHYIVRTSWVVGDGPDFVATMRRLARAGASPSVVDDQVGRLTRASDLARATRHLLGSGAPPGTYDVTSGGPARSWADVARTVFADEGRDPDDVVAVPTRDYAAGRQLAPRPARSVLSTARIEATGYELGPDPLA
jgi:dTDP-4-dehydrorhamnose reductase/dTDP-4-dehydrorhamnose 3,5-epimerase